MRTERQLVGVAFAAALAVSSCTWGRSSPEDCARYAISNGNLRLEQLAGEAGLEQVTVTHSLCSDKRERLDGVGTAARSEVGWCTRIKESIPASRAAVAASVQGWCATAVQRQVAYTDWSSAIGDRFLFVAQYDVLESQRGGPPAKVRR